LCQLACHPFDSGAAMGLAAHFVYQTMMHRDAGASTNQTSSFTRINIVLSCKLNCKCIVCVKFSK